MSEKPLNDSDANSLMIDLTEFVRQQQVIDLSECMKPPQAELEKGCSITEAELRRNFARAAFGVQPSQAQRENIACRDRETARLSAKIKVIADQIERDDPSNKCNPDEDSTGLIKRGR